MNDSNARPMNWSFRDLLPALIAVACIDTHVAPPPPIPLCIQRAPADARPIVVVNADLGSLGYIQCSGVLVSPKVVLTHLGCLVLPPDVYGEVPPEVEAPELGSRSVFPYELDYRALCSSEHDWFLTEDGSFAGRFEEPVVLSSLEVTPSGDRSELSAVSVRSVFRSRSVSRCADGLAVLVLNSELELGPQPTLRVTDQTKAGDPVSLVGSHTSIASQIDRVTFSQGDAMTPPRALVLRHAACLADAGGGVFSATPSALIGIIELGLKDACDDPAGETIALRLSPFVGLLITAAEDAGETLYLEAAPEAPELSTLSDCAPP